jgi:protease-4
MAERKNILFVVLFAAAASIAVLFFAVYLGLIFFAGSDWGFGDKVAVVDVRGEIFYDLSKVQEIESYRDDDDVKAVVVFINSPGGGVSASQAIYEALKRVQKRKPVVAFMASVAASGGYYVACAADSIVSHEGTLTGSIGVIASFLHTDELYQKLGLDVSVIKTGKYKDVGSPHRSMTDEERDYLADLLDSVYQQFLEAVSEGRGLPVGQVRRLAEGRLYSGAEAKRVGLVDRLGTYEDAVRMAADMAGLGPNPRIVRRLRKRSLFERVLGAAPPQLPFSSDERVNLKYIIP